MQKLSVGTQDASLLKDGLWTSNDLSKVNGPGIVNKTADELELLDTVIKEEDVWQSLHGSLRSLESDTLVLKNSVVTFMTEWKVTRDRLAEIQEKCDSLKIRLDQLSLLKQILVDLKDDLSFSQGSLNTLEVIRKLQDPEKLCAFLENENNRRDLIDVMEKIYKKLTDNSLSTKFSILAVRQKRFEMKEIQRLVVQRSKGYILNLIHKYRDIYENDQSRLSSSLGVIQWKDHSELQNSLLECKIILEAISDMDLEGLQFLVRFYTISMRPVYTKEMMSFFKVIWKKTHHGIWLCLIGSKSKINLGDVMKVFEMLHPAHISPSANEEKYSCSIEDPFCLAFSELKIIPPSYQALSLLPYDSNRLHADPSVCLGEKEYLRPDIAMNLCIIASFRLILWEENILENVFSIVSADKWSRNIGDNFDDRETELELTELHSRQDLNERSLIEIFAGVSPLHLHLLQYGRHISQMTSEVNSSKSFLMVFCEDIQRLEGRRLAETRYLHCELYRIIRNLLERSDGIFSFPVMCVLMALKESDQVLKSVYCRFIINSLSSTISGTWALYVDLQKKSILQCAEIYDPYKPKKILASIGRFPCLLKALSLLYAPLSAIVQKYADKELSLAISDMLECLEKVFEILLQKCEMVNDTLPPLNEQTMLKIINDIESFEPLSSFYHSRLITMFRHYAFFSVMNVADNFGDTVKLVLGNFQASVSEKMRIYRTCFLRQCLIGCNMPKLVSILKQNGSNSTESSFLDHSPPVLGNKPEKLSGNLKEFMKEIQKGIDYLKKVIKDFFSITLNYGSIVVDMQSALINQLIDAFENEILTVLNKVKKHIFVQGEDKSALIHQVRASFVKIRKVPK